MSPWSRRRSVLFLVRWEGALPKFVRGMSGWMSEALGSGFGGERSWKSSPETRLVNRFAKEAMLAIYGHWFRDDERENVRKVLK